MEMKRIAACLMLLTTIAWVLPLDAQVRGARRTAVVKGEEGKGVAVGPRGVAVKGEEGYAAAGRHGAVRTGDEGYAAVGRHGAVVQGEEGYARDGPRGAVVAGDEGYRAVGRGGDVVGSHYESYEAWKVVSGVGAAIAVGTILTKPPKSAAPVSQGGSTYYYDSGTFYTRVISNGSTVYQVVQPPAGAVVATLPSGCSSVHVGGVAYSQCGSTHYQKVSNGYQVVVLQ